MKTFKQFLNNNINEGKRPTKSTQAEIGKAKKVLAKELAIVNKKFKERSIDNDYARNKYARSVAKNIYNNHNYTAIEAALLDYGIEHDFIGGMNTIADFLTKEFK